MTKNFLYSGAITVSDIDMKYAKEGSSKDDIKYHFLSKKKNFWEIDASKISFGADGKAENTHPLQVIFDSRKNYNVLPISLHDKIVLYLEG